MPRAIGDRPGTVFELIAGYIGTFEPYDDDGVPTGEVHPLTVTDETEAQRSIESDAAWLCCARGLSVRLSRGARAGGY